jgi:hypothetical protein
MDMKCKHCDAPRSAGDEGDGDVAVVYCCADAKMDALLDEAIMMLESEVMMPTIGSVDSAAPMQLVVSRLREVREVRVRAAA